MTKRQKNRNLSLHFLFEMTKGSVLVAPFCAVNESTFEHMKLLYFPLLIFSLIQYKYMGSFKDCFLWVKLIGILCGIFLIPVLYYTYTGALGISADWFNIAIFFISSAAAFFVEYLLFKNPPSFCPGCVTVIIIFCVLTAVFVLFTFMPPRIPLFKDPLTNGFGI